MAVHQNGTSMRRLLTGLILSNPVTCLADLRAFESQLSQSIGKSLRFYHVCEKDLYNSI